MTTTTRDPLTQAIKTGTQTYVTRAATGYTTQAAVTLAIRLAAPAMVVSAAPAAAAAATVWVVAKLWDAIFD